MKKLLFIILILLIPFTAYSANIWRGTNSGGVTPVGATLINDLDTVLDGDVVEPLERMLNTYRRGAKLKYNSGATVDVTLGSIACSNSGASIRRMRQNTADISLTFADIDVGAEASETTYYVYGSCDADANTFVGKISASSSTPTGLTYFVKLGSFYNNASSNIEQVTNDNDDVIISTGTVAHGATVSVPSGFSADECDWMPSLYGGTATTNAINDIDVSLSSSRVATCRWQNNNWVDGGASSWTSVTCNYSILCHR